MPLSVCVFCDDDATKKKKQRDENQHRQRTALATNTNMRPCYPCKQIRRTKKNEIVFETGNLIGLFLKLFLIYIVSLSILLFLLAILNSILRM